VTDLATELLALADDLDGYGGEADAEEVSAPLSALEEAAKTIGKAWSGSWLGYQANVYFSTLKPPPPGTHFSQEPGLQEPISNRENVRGWREFDSDELEKAIRELAGNPDTKSAKALADRARIAFEDAKSEVVSLLTTAQQESPDTFVSRLQEGLEGLKLHSRADVLNALRPAGVGITGDFVALQQGHWIPPHIAVLAEVISLRSPPSACRELARLCRKGGSHLRRRDKRTRKKLEIGTNVFIGHGRSNVWRDLKDFVQERLKLPWDEFNRLPIAGVTNIARLSEMLDASAIAFLVMTAEDEQIDGKLHARMNVVHEAGLFQGRLGFTRAIVLLEEGCEEFTNIQGLGQIRFPKDNIKAVFEDVRLVIEREGVIEVDDRGNV